MSSYSLISYYIKQNLNYKKKEKIIKLMGGKTTYFKQVDYVIRLTFLKLCATAP